MIKSDKDDWKKLRRILTWVKNTMKDKSIIDASIIQDIFMWVDAEYAVHAYIQSQTGVSMVIVWGVVHANSGKHKINTKSSTEAGVVGTSEYLPYNIWLLVFLLDQGYRIVNNTLYQDKKSSIKMDRNGINYCTGNSIHINI